MSDVTGWAHQPGSLQQCVLTHLPHTKVGHGGGNSRDGRDLMLGQQAAQAPKVPPKVQLLVKEALRCISAVQGWLHSERAPEGSLKQLIPITTCGK